ncbi:hypothetical protein [Paraburkholderia aromaticivorans]|uniref:Lysozyme inhibitor LprI N-terminal domain-containing protein n=1 Tax=Paraburkholderia aromaticivorans TaxID=2026199 RepID=A0A248VWW0_9BURK|nr:hypothetical protein [Paraburkholderia aromaticivorans]ASW03478.1 hypothetical protein CJU94_35510 [Paraburkholderia aromaticivorans]
MHLKLFSAVLLSVATLGSTGAWASDIQCSTTRQPAERVICDHAILNNEYDDIFAEQRALLSAGKLSPEQIARWRQTRNACTDVHCIDTVFSQWKAVAKSANAATATVSGPAVASATTAPGSIAPISDAYALASDTSALPASQALPTSEASLVRQGSAAGVALPQPVASQASLPTVASAASGASEPRGVSGLSAGLAPVVLIAIALGAFVYRRNKAVGRSGESPRRPR